MAITQAYSGTKLVDATEWSCTTDTAGPDLTVATGVYQVFLDVSDMIAGDQLQIVIYEKARSADTQRIVTRQYLAGAQAEPIWVSASLVLMHGWDVTLKTLAGTSITVLWSIRKVA